MPTVHQITVRRLRRTDARACAALHQAAFPGELLPALGPGVLTLLYRRVAEREGAYGLVALDGRRAVGAAFGVADGPAFRRAFARAGAWRLAGAVALRAPREPILRRGLRRRVADRLRPRARTALAPVTRARLLSIGVAPAWRGRGVAERLADGVCSAMAADGIAAVGLSVRTGNPRALAFYERTGWTRERTEPGAVYLARPTASSSPSAPAT